MSSIKLTAEHVVRSGDENEGPPHVATARDNTKSRIPLAPILVTLGAVAVAALLAWAMWDAYMVAPWTRDGTVRVYIVTTAPEVAGRIVRLPAGDNQLVHKGDVLFEIEPSDYRIALQSAVAGEGADPQAAFFFSYVRQFLSRIEIDQHRRLRETEIHRRHEALAAGQDLAVVLVLREQCERFGKARGSEIVERRRLHVF